MKQTKMIIVYSGTEITVNLLREELEKSGIGAYIRNDFNSGVMAGFFGDVPSVVDLYIEEQDLPVAEPIIQQFIEVNQV